MQSTRPAVLTNPGRLAGLAAALIMAGSMVAWQSSGFPPGGPPRSQPTTRPSEDPGQPSTPDVPGLPTPEELFVQGIQKAHNADEWPHDGTLRARLFISAGGELVVDGLLTYDIATGRSRIDIDDPVEGTLVFDGEHAWVSPSTLQFDKARFHLLAWPYFLIAPFKITDPGTHIELVGPQTLNAKICDTARLSFEGDVGDTPNDWYYLCADPVTRRLSGLVYIMTYDRSIEEANHDPKAIVYTGYTTVGGVKLSTNWQFYRWDPTVGTHGAPTARGRINEIEFITPEEGLFDRPADAREDWLPMRQ